MTFRIIYSSASSTPMQLDELEDLLEQAQANNPSQRITGALVYADGFFLQILEGERARVEELMQIIARDLRHEKVRVLYEGEVREPAFSDWSMAYVSATPEQVARWAGLSSTTELPEVWEDIRHNPAKAAQLTESILEVLMRE